MNDLTTPALRKRMGDLNCNRIPLLRPGHPLRLAYDCLLLSVNGSVTQPGMVDICMTRLERRVEAALAAHDHYLTRKVANEGLS